MYDGFYNDSISKLKPYKINATDAWSKNNDTLKIDWNESTVPPSPKVIEGIKELIAKARFNWYPPLVNHELLNLLADYADVNSNNIQYFAGSDSLHEYLTHSCLCKGDVVLIISPTYDNFRSLVASQGAKIVDCPLGEDFNIKAELLRERIEKAKPKLIYLCNPNNPTGTTYSKEYCEDLVRNFPRSLFIFDEAYFEFSGVTAASLVKSYNNVIVCRTFSKAFGLASFRIGYAIAPLELLDVVNKIRNPKSVALISQIAAVKALQDVEYMLAYTKEVAKAKALLENYFKSNNISYVYGGGNYMMIRADIFDKDAFIIYLEQADILVRNLNHLDTLEQYFRVTVGTQKQMTRVIECFDSYLRLQSHE